MEMKFITPVIEIDLNFHFANIKKKLEQIICLSENLGQKQSLFFSNFSSLNKFLIEQMFIIIEVQCYVNHVKFKH